MQSSSTGLNYLEFNPPSTSSTSSTQTLLLLHSGYSSHIELLPLLHHLSRLIPAVHILIPDLPSHGTFSSRTIPFSLPTCAALLSELIQEKSPTGRAHVVGVSLGGLVGLYLAATHPGVVDAVFVTGCGVSIDPTIPGAWPSWRSVKLAVQMGLLHPTIMILVAWLPRWTLNALYGYLGLLVPSGLQDGLRAAAGYGLGMRLALSVLRGEIGLSMLEGVKSRALLVAAGKDDDVEGTRAMGVLLKRGNADSRSVVVGGMRHVWCLQDPEMFAECAVSWLVHGKVHEMMEGLDWG
jgi:pimeloyl-ACP methyl ester carboxylesterase